MKAIYIIILFFNVVTAFSCFAADSEENQHVLMTPHELEIQDVARNRLYPGGRDEEPLKVLSVLPQSVRKMGPATEAPEEDTTPAAERD